jgi:uncharacterized membrane protein YagU involved in acid resistance
MSKAGMFGQDVVLGALSGYLATKVMEPVSMQLYRRQSESDRQREDTARPGAPYEIAAAKTAGVVGIELSEQQRSRAGLVFHYGLGAGFAPLYALVRRRWRTPVVPTAAGVGVAMSLIVDEGITPLLGFSAPNRAYPAATHLRGLLAHLAFGAAAAAVTEAGWALCRRRPSTTDEQKRRRRGR